MTYQEAYKCVYQNRDSISWHDFAKGRLDFPDFALLPAPISRDDPAYYRDWQPFFADFFGVKYIHYSFFVRILNSALSLLII